MMAYIIIISSCSLIMNAFTAIIESCRWIVIFYIKLMGIFERKLVISGGYFYFLNLKLKL
jgi:hypothetical protein